MDMHRIAEVAAAEMKYRASHQFKEKGNKFYHGQRVANSVKVLAEMIGYEGDLSEVTVAAWFHDISNGDVSHAEHGRVGAEKTKGLIGSLCTDNELSRIVSIIEIHDMRDAEGLTTEEKLLQDADLLDHFGVFEIWNTFQFALKESMSMSQTASLILENLKKDRRHMTQLHFEASRKILSEKLDYVQKFAERMTVEANGEFIT